MISGSTATWNKSWRGYSKCLYPSICWWRMSRVSRICTNSVWLSNLRWDVSWLATTITPTHASFL